MAEREHDGSEWGPANPPPATPKAWGLTEAEIEKWKTTGRIETSFGYMVFLDDTGLRVLATISQLRTGRDLLVREVEASRDPMIHESVHNDADAMCRHCAAKQRLIVARAAVDAAGIKIGGGK